MGIQDQEERAKQRIIQRQAQAVTRQQTTPRTGTIGAFLPNGKFEVNLPDGGKGQGVKIYNSRHDAGDTVLLSDRGDGTYILDGPKAPPPRKELNIDSLDNRCKGYLKGQIFHCDEERKETIIAWAIEKTAGGAYVLRNLITGENYALEAPPATVPPCAPPPPNFPTPPDSEPVDPGALWYTHVWNTQSWATPLPNSRCSDAVPIHPNDLGNSSESILQLRSELNGTEWKSRSGAGAHNANGFNEFWNSNSLSTTTQSATPPPIDQVPFLVLGNAVVGGSVQFNSRINLNTLSWVYVSGSCPSVNYPGVAPPIDSRDPNGTPIPNVIEATLSIGEDLGPIAHIRHTPNCVSPGVWNSEKSYTLKANVNGVPQLQTTSGKLTTDWRYKNPAIPCRNTFRSELFTNLDFTGVRLWSIETPDRPATITPGTPIQLKVTNKSLDTGCTATVIGSKLTTAQVTGNNPVTIVAIAVKIIKR